MNTDTPETNRRIIQQDPRMCGCGYKSEITYADFARLLERERNQARQDRDELHEVCNRIAEHAVNDPQQALAELLAMDGILRKALKKLKEPKTEGV